MPNTTNYNWSYPTVGGSQDTWGDTLNATIISIDSQTKTIENAIPTSIIASSITDTPNTFTANAFVKVNSGGNALEFTTASITNLSDTPSSLGSANQILKMNSGGTALEWGTDSSGSGGLTYSDFSATTLSSPASGYPNGVLVWGNNGTFTYAPPDLSAYQTTASASKVYTSGWQNFGTINTSNVVPFTHSLGGEPDIVQMQFKCTTANIGYSVGEIVTKQDGLSDASDVFGFYHDNTTQIKVVEPYYQRVRIINRSNGQPNLITASSWQWRVKCVKI